MSAMPDVDPALTAALGYAARGWRVLPIKPGTKRPPMQAWQDHATTDPEIITGWWTGLYKGYGVGIATGKESGVWGLDIDEWEVLVDLEKANTPLPRTFTVTTGSGGSHYYFAYPTDMEITNANQLPRGIDVRGEGGQLVAPPTTHPDTGQVYMQEHSSPSTIAQAPAWLLELVKPPERPEVADRPTTPSPDAGHRPGDIWAAQTSWADILGPDGWTFKYAARDNGGDMWTRPGKEPRQGVSASVGHKGSDVLKVFTSSIEGMGLAEGETYTKIGYLAATRHSGDHSAAAAWLASQGHREDERQVIADMIGDFPEQAPMIELPPRSWITPFSRTGPAKPSFSPWNQSETTGPAMVRMAFSHVVSAPALRTSAIGFSDVPFTRSLRITERRFRSKVPRGSSFSSGFRMKRLPSAQVSWITFSGSSKCLELMMRSACIPGPNMPT